mmetsp:Transcript_50499/g.123149  ORF Transcript_50499/g.123149 Transcript_50499/m.123149 type:complete len:304 (+) Transcript_50499:831-1742(+)
MVLDVSGPENGVCALVCLHRSLDKLIQDLLHRLTHDVAQHIEPPPVRHPDLDARTSKRHGPVDSCLDAWDEAFDSLEPEPLRYPILGREERLKVRRKHKPIVHVEDLCLGEVELVLLFELVPDPVLLLHVRDVCELHPDSPAVGSLESREDLPKSLLLSLSKHTSRGCPDSRPPQLEGAVKIVVSEAVCLVVEERRDGLIVLHVDVGTVDLERVEVCQVVPPNLIRPNQQHQLHVVSGGLVSGTDLNHCRLRPPRKGGGEGVGLAHGSIVLQVGKKDLPALVHRCWVLFPLLVNTLHIVPGCP